MLKCTERFLNSKNSGFILKTLTVIHNEVYEHSHSPLFYLSPQFLPPIVGVTAQTEWQSARFDFRKLVLTWFQFWYADVMKYSDYRCLVLYSKEHKYIAGKESFNLLVYTKHVLNHTRRNLESHHDIKWNVKLMTKI